MPTITNPNLTLSEFIDTDGKHKVTIQVTYNAVFSQCERSLSPNLKFRETIKIVGVDFSPPSEQGLLDILPVQEIPVIAGSGSFTVQRTRTGLALRSLLQEDPGPDPDDIRCKISIAYVGASTPVVSASANALPLAG
jgi:hypothetical protein